MFKVELLCFSGRRNPDWTIDELPDLSKLKPGGSFSVPQRLGYNGIMARCLDRNIELLVFHENVQLKRDGKVFYYRDDKKIIQQWLIEQGKYHVGHMVLESLLCR